ncbi:DUF1643 domain-containing protein [Microbacterium halotolerans]|uniref:DUF1643 domain-containing protein n=1 Tax=Microbacterium halotolerans TaxID=246613 RepID=UPI0013C2E8E9|nr:DUF1643 domain-containing protein [Microbacterium halotolerans]
MSATADHKWIYEPSSDDTARFVLGTVGENPLICVGVNPSTAKPGEPDRTVTRVANFAATNGYDSWIMLNVYPLRATNPDDLPRVADKQLMAANVDRIRALIDDRPLTLLAAWGNLITSRTYLRDTLDEIQQVTAAAGCSWVTLGEPTKMNHPRHPSRRAANTPLLPFDIDRYRRETLRTA